LKDLGVIDFAGGAVVHINAGIAALVTALFIGKRIGYNKMPLPPHNLPFTVLGTALLWFGWFGFNAGSALSASGLAVHALVATHVAAATAGLTWALLEWIYTGKPTVFGTVTGSIAGLATVTAASGYVDVLAAIIIGVLASLLCFVCVSMLKPRLGYDDSLDAFGVHGAGGILGMLSTGFFASKAINPGGPEGALFGNPHQLLVQLVAVLAVVAYSLAATYILYRAVNLFVAVRVTTKDEILGLDLTQHNETAYTVLE
jgi:Amt family ammonium transporter